MAMLGPSGIAARLRELAAYLRLYGESPFRARAYDAAATAVEALGGRLGDLIAADRLTEIPGVGPKLAAAIRELSETGTTRLLERYQAELPVALATLTDLPGLTVGRLRGLRESLGIESAEDLERAAREGRLQQARGFGPRTEAKLLAALERRKHERPALLLHRARETAQRLADQLRATPGVRAAEVAGAIRRWQEVVDGVCLCAAADEPAAALAGFLNSIQAGETLLLGEAHARFRLLTGGLAEVHVVPPAAYAATLLRQTGPAHHVEALRVRARHCGLDLETMTAENEATIYATLGLAALAPEQREDPEQLALAIAGDDFHDLVDLADVRGLVHCHTTASDGRDDLVAMAEGAGARGMSYLTITDHSENASYAGGLSASRLREQGAAIAELRRRGDLAVDVLHGTEADILADGGLDVPHELVDTLDLVIASVHNRYGMDEDATTRRLCAALGQPMFKIWGHGTGRLLLNREPVPCRMEEVLDAAVAGGTAIEINANPHRLDLEPRWLRLARQRRLRFVISVDAHSVREYDNLRYGVQLARRAGIRKDEVLNTLPGPAFRAAVQPRRSAT